MLKDSHRAELDMWMVWVGGGGGPLGEAFDKICFKLVFSVLAKINNNTVCTDTYPPGSIFTILQVFLAKVILMR